MYLRLESLGICVPAFILLSCLFRRCFPSFSQDSRKQLCLSTWGALLAIAILDGLPHSRNQCHLESNRKAGNVPWSSATWGQHPCAHTLAGDSSASTAICTKLGGDCDYLER